MDITTSINYDSKKLGNIRLSKEFHGTTRYFEQTYNYNGKFRKLRYLTDWLPVVDVKFSGGQKLDDIKIDASDEEYMSLLEFISTLDTNFARFVSLYAKMRGKNILTETEKTIEKMNKHPVLEKIEIEDEEDEDDEVKLVKKVVQTKQATNNGINVYSFDLHPEDPNPNGYTGNYSIITAGELYFKPKFNLNADKIPINKNKKEIDILDSDDEEIDILDSDDEEINEIILLGNKNDLGAIPENKEIGDGDDDDEIITPEEFEELLALPNRDPLIGMVLAFFKRLEEKRGLKTFTKLLIEKTKENERSPEAEKLVNLFLKFPCNNTRLMITADMIKDSVELLDYRFRKSPIMKLKANYYTKHLTPFIRMHIPIKGGGQNANYYSDLVSYNISRKYAPEEKITNLHGLKRVLTDQKHARFLLDPVFYHTETDGKLFFGIKLIVRKMEIKYNKDTRPSKIDKSVYKDEMVTRVIEL